jgi:glycosyltransferase involved in cell wall biosynthesis
MPTPLVSVLINNFNYARYLPQSIESALAQTYPRLEVLVVDDASSDDSRQVMGRYADRVLLVLQERNGGQGAAINAGFRASRGDIVMLLDADDYLYPHAVERVAAAWVPGQSQMQYRLDLVDATGQRLDTYPPPEVQFDSGDVVPLLLGTGRYETSVTSGTAFARTTLEKVLPIPEESFRISADGYLVTVAPFHGTVGVIEEALGAYRQHGGNAWATSSDSLGALGERLRRSLQHDACKYAALIAKAQEFGLRVVPGHELRDPQHLATRLASLRIDSAKHPFPADSRLHLALRGARQVLGARLSRRRRLTLAGWHLAVGLLPGPLATRAVTWRLQGASRPEWADRLLKALRRAIR